MSKMDASYVAKKTFYRGVTFQSRLEAQWAYFLDQHGIRWLYEPNRIRLDDGTDYVPDFFLSGLNCWLEVKGT